MPKVCDCLELFVPVWKASPSCLPSPVKGGICGSGEASGGVISTVQWVSGVERPATGLVAGDGRDVGVNIERLDLVRPRIISRAGCGGCPVGSGAGSSPTRVGAANSSFSALRNLA